MAKGEFRRKAEVPSTEQILKMAASGERLSRAQATAVIASKLTPKPGQDDGVLRNNVQNAIAYGIATGTLADPGVAGFAVSEIIEWARQRFPKDCPKFDGLPHLFRGTLGAGPASVSGVLTVSRRAPELPATIEECHLRILEMDAQVVRLTESERELERQLAEEKPLADKWRDFLATRRKGPAA